nr:hypothetical protein [uncultured Sphingorhabdus sp.]
MARQTGIVLAPPLIIIGDECFVRIAHSDADHDALSINHAAQAARAIAWVMAPTYLLIHYVLTR